MDGSCDLEWCVEAFWRILVSLVFVSNEIMRSVLTLKEQAVLVYDNKKLISDRFSCPLKKNSSELCIQV